LKNELKMIQVAKADLTYQKKRKKRAGTYSTASAKAEQLSRSESDTEFIEQVGALKDKVFEKNSRIANLKK
jgi:hypothetical protein